MLGRKLMLFVLMSTAVPVVASPSTTTQTPRCSTMATGVELAGREFGLFNKTCSGTWSGFRCIGLGSNCPS